MAQYFTFKFSAETRDDKKLICSFVNEVKLDDAEPENGELSQERKSIYLTLSGARDGGDMSNFQADEEKIFGKKV